jgi:hypothetical protein
MVISSLVFIFNPLTPSAADMSPIEVTYQQILRIFVYITL